MSPKQGLKCAIIDGYRVQWKDDGVDYPAIWRNFKENRLNSLIQLKTQSPYRHAFLYKAENGRPLLLKHDWEKDPRFEKKVWRFLAGPWYSRLIHLTNWAIQGGCTVLQDVYLVAEKMEGRFAADSWLIAEFVEGTVVPSTPYYHRFFKEMARAVGELHDFGLASNDAHAQNFIVTLDEKIKVIDLSLTSPILICQANDIFQLKRAYNVDVPVRGLRRRLAAFLIRVKQKIRALRRGRKKG